MGGDGLTRFLCPYLGHLHVFLNLVLSILLRIVASVFPMHIGLYFSFSVVFLSGLGIRVALDLSAVSLEVFCPT